jgi:hypothetical protein
MKKMTILGFLMVVMFACSTEIIAPETGSLDISVSIGPLCPVEPCKKTAEEIKMIYEAYSFVVKDTKSNTIVLEQKITHNGTNGILNATSIAVGEYELDVKPQTLFTKSGFPKLFTIQKDKTTKLEVDIDTGIR